MKTEPEKYSIDDLERDTKTPWNGVRNYQAQGNLKKMQLKDLCFIYHTQTERRIVGLGEIVGLYEPEVPLVAPIKPGNWGQVWVAYLKRLKPFKLSEIKQLGLFEGSAVVRQSRLSVCPFTEIQGKWLLDNLCL